MNYQNDEDTLEFSTDDDETSVFEEEDVQPVQDITYEQIKMTTDPSEEELKEQIKRKFKVETMTKKEFFIEVAERLDVPVRVVDEFFDAFVFVLKEKLIAEVKVQLSTLGTFEVKVKKGRTTVNPFQENKEIVVPEKRIVKYTPSKYLREIVNF